MDSLAAYRDDVYAWSREQAAVLRQMIGHSGMPNALDLGHVAEEIESVGSEARHAVESHIRLILVHLMKIVASANTEQRPRWRAESQSFHSEIEGRYTRSMRQDIDLDRLWRRAIRDARAALAVYGEELPAKTSDLCPLDLDAFTTEIFDIDGALRRVGAALGGDGQD